MQHENISSYLYVFHLCFKCMTPISKQYEPLNFFSHEYYCQIAVEEVCDAYYLKKIGNHIWWLFDGHCIVYVVFFENFVIMCNNMVAITMLHVSKILISFGNTTMIAMLLIWAMKWGPSYCVLLLLFWLPLQPM